jgi:ribosomal-protein-alanine N-acetyltransferase
MSEFLLHPIDAADARAIASWRYDPPYDVYEFDHADVLGLTNPSGRYSAVRRHEELIAYVCLGAEARVTGLGPAQDTDDLGFGLRPDLMGQGLSRDLFPWMLRALENQIVGTRLRVVILDWNARSLAAYRRAGFRDEASHRTADGTYLLLTRSLTST